MKNKVDMATVTASSNNVTSALSTEGAIKPPGDDDEDGPSWGLIIPIIMIGVFLLSVASCLWWHKWRDKMILRDQPSAFNRSYRGSRSSRSGFDAVRDSTRSTTPLRSSVNEKIANNNNYLTKTKSVNVIPVQQRQNTTKFTFYWDKNHWRAYPTMPTMPTSGRASSKPLSPIDEIDSPSSVKLSELSGNYDVHAQASFSPYHLTWCTSSNPPTSYERSDPRRDNRMSYPPQTRVSDAYHVTTPVSYPREEQVENSPFFPNNNTPTTECDADSETSHIHVNNVYQEQGYSSHLASYPSSPKSSIPSISNTRLTSSTETETYRTSGTSFPETSLCTGTTSREESRSGFQTSSSQSGQTSRTDQTSDNYSSLPSSIAAFSKQNVLLDDNNNSLVPNAYISYPMSKILNFTLASSVASSDTQISDNTSLLPNVGSNTVEPSMPTSPEDLSKLVDEMSSIRPVEESTSTRPNSSSMDPSTRIISISGASAVPDLQRSWSLEHASGSSTNTYSQPSQNGSLCWDSYPLNQSGSKSYPDIPLQMHDSFVQQTQQHNYFRPVLMETQYWV